MTITYEVKNGLYVNLTNRCTNDCVFCLRNSAKSVYDSELWLEREPSRDEILKDILGRDLSKYDELVFCGYGEPMMRMFDIIWIARKIKEQIKITIRINTNGHANMIYHDDVTPILEGVIDIISISLNAPTSEEYIEICKPVYGENSFDGIIDFAKKCKNFVPQVIFTVVDSIPAEDIEACRKIAEEAGVSFRVREFIEN